MVVFMRMLCCGPGCCKGCCWKRSWSQMCCSARCCLECSEGGQERDGRQNLQSCYDDSKKIPVQLFWTLEEYHSAVVFIYAYIDIYTKIIWSFHQTQLNVSKNPCVRGRSPVLFMQEPPVSSVWRKEVVKIFKCCFGDSFEISFYPGPIVLLCRSLSRYMFCKPSWHVCYMDLSNYYMYFLTSILPQITKKVDQDFEVCVTMKLNI